MSTPRYSIVIPTFRRGPDLADCLETLTRLEYPLSEIEVVVVDNGGAENTRSVATP